MNSLGNHRLYPLIVCLLLVPLLGCGGSVDELVSPDATTDTQPVEDAGPSAIADGQDPVDSSGDIQEVKPIYPESFSTCGQPPYSWLEPQGLGELVESEYMAEWSLSKDLAALAITAAGLGEVIEARYGVDIYRVRFTTQKLGEQIEATGVVALPVLEDDEAIETHAVVIMGPTTGFADSCAGSATDANARAASVYATQGQIVVVPDYVGKTSMGGDDGMRHPYLVAEPAAMVGWDGLRAGLQALKQDERELIHDGRVVLWGASQGGHAVYAVERYAPYYAPEFEVVTAVTLIAPGDIVGQTAFAFDVYAQTAKGVLASLITAADWYGLWPRITEVIRDDDAFPVASWLRAQMEEICYPELADLGVDSLDDLFSPSFLVAMETQDWTGFEDWRCALESNSPLGSHLPRISDTPFLSILSADDTLVNAEIELQHQIRLCEAGYDIAQVLCEAAGHVEGPGWSLTEQFNWIADRVAGLPLPEVCQTPEVTCCTNTPPDRCSEP